MADLVGNLLRTERKCPGCGTGLRLPVGKSGTVRCPECQIRFRADTRAIEDSQQSGRDHQSRELQIKQGSPEWLKLRMTLRMASETPAILGLSPYQTSDQVRAAKQGARGFQTAAMRKGTQQEPIARAAYETAFVRMRPAFFVAGDYGCSLDGISQDRSTIIEVKTPYKGRESDRWRAAVKGVVADHDYAQIQHQLMVSRATIAHLWVWDAEGRQGKLVEVRPAQDFWNRIRVAWDNFWPTIDKCSDRS